MRPASPSGMKINGDFQESIQTWVQFPKQQPILSFTPSKPWNSPSAVRKHVVVTSVDRLAMAASFTGAGKVVSRIAATKRRVRPSRRGRWAATYSATAQASGNRVAYQLPMIVSSWPLGACHPHRLGVRLGKCQANKKVYSASVPDRTF